jgi:predicted DNA-binding antitoxin AbrB/MazE fold protein
MAHHQQVDAVYENGVLRPLSPVQLRESERVMVSITQTHSERNEERSSMVDRTFHEYARAQVELMGRVPSLEEIRKGLSTMKDSMAEAIISERGEY